MFIFSSTGQEGSGRATFEYQSCVQPGCMCEARCKLLQPRSKNPYQTTCQKSLLSDTFIIPLYIPISWSGFMRGDNIFCCQSPHHPPLGGSPFLSNCFASARIVTGNIWEPGWTRDWNGWTQFSGTSLWILIHEQSEIWICSPTEMIPKSIAGIALLLVARRQFHCLPRELRQRHETLHEFAPPGGNQAGMFFQPGAMV